MAPEKLEHIELCHGELEASTFLIALKHKAAFRKVENRFFGIYGWLKS
jgi:hypothetical protein